MGDPSVPDEQEDIARVISENDFTHGPGDLDKLPPSDFEEEELLDGGEIGDLLKKDSEEDTFRDAGGPS